MAFSIIQVGFDAVRERAAAILRPGVRGSSSEQHLRFGATDRAGYYEFSDQRATGGVIQARPRR
jgi:hypothetical protein